MAATTSVEKSVTTFRFTVTLGNTPEPPAALSDAEWNARMDELMDEVCGKVHSVGCDDASLGARGSVFFLGFDREAESLADAVASAIRDVEKVGFKVSRVELDEAGD